MSNNKKDFKLSIGVKVVMVVLIIATLIIFLVTLKDSYNNENVSGKIDKYTSIESLYLNTNIDIQLPEWVESRDDLEIRNILGQIIEIGCNDFVIKIANFIDVNADPLGLYEKSETDNSYYIDTEDSNIKYFRYRLGYANYTNCTLVNWCTDTTSYGMMLSNIYKEDEIFKLFDIDYTWLNSNDNNEIVADDTQVYDIGGEFNINLPIFESNISVNNLDGYTTIYIDKKLCIILVYNDYDIDNNTFKSNDTMQLNEDIVMYYYKDNPFKAGSVAYNDYNKFLSTINNIADSIIYQN